MMWTTSSNGLQDMIGKNMPSTWLHLRIPILTLPYKWVTWCFMGELLNKQHRFYLQHEQSLVEKYRGQFIVIHDEQVIDSFGSERDAYIFSVKQFPIGTFLIREVRAKTSSS